MLQAAAAQLLTFGSDLLRYIAAPAIVVAAVAWLARELIRGSLERETNRLRAGLERDSAVQLEQLRHEWLLVQERVRHDLDRQLDEHRVRFATLQDRRVQLIVDLYAVTMRMAESAKAGALFAELRLDFKDWRFQVDEVSRLVQEARAAHAAALLYLPEAVSDRVGEIIESASAAHFTMVIEAAPGENTPEQIAAKVVALKLHELPIRVKSLEVDFRRLFGVERSTLESVTSALTSQPRQVSSADPPPG